MNLESYVDVHGMGSYVVGPDEYELMHPNDINTTAYCNGRPIAEIGYSALCSILNEFGTTYQDEKLRIMEAVYVKDPSFKIELMKHMEREVDSEEPFNSELWKKIRQSVKVSEIYRHYGEEFDSSGRNVCLMSHAPTFWKDVVCTDDRQWKCSCCGESGDAFDLLCALKGTHQGNGKSNFWAASFEFSHLAGDRLFKQWRDVAVEYTAKRRRDHLSPHDRREAEKKALFRAMDKMHFMCFQDKEAMIAFIPSNPLSDPSLKSVQAFYHWYYGHKIEVMQMNKKGELNPTMVPVAKVWLDREIRPKYHGMTFCPKDELPLDRAGFYNTWAGFPAVPKEGDFSRIDYHLRHIWCRDNLKHYNYLIGWFAHLFQKPWEIPEVALVIKGSQGTGKSIIMGGLFRRLLGRYYLQVDKSELVSGRFNQHFVGKLLITNEESLFHGDQAAYNVTKNLITSSVIPIEEKGRNPREEHSYLRLVFLSNEEVAVAADGLERRYFGLSVSDEKANDHAYFEELAYAIGHGEAEAFMHYLLHLDLSNFNVRNQPKTDALAVEFLSNLPPEQQWLFEMLNDEAAHYGTPRHWSNNDRDNEHDMPIFGRRVPTARLWQMYLQFMEDCQKSGRYMRQNGPASQTALTRKLNAFLGMTKNQDIRSSENRSQRAIDMPDGKTFRGIFEKKIRSGFSWDFELTWDGNPPDEYGSDLFREKEYMKVVEDPQIYPFVPEDYMGDDTFSMRLKGL